MNVDYSWSIPQIDVEPQSGGRANVVKRLHWRIKGKRDGYTTDAYGTVELPPPAGGGPFVALDDITPAQAVAWIEGALGSERVAELKATILAALNEIASPSVVAMAPPWGQQESEA